MLLFGTLHTFHQQQKHGINNSCRYIKQPCSNNMTMRCMSSSFGLMERQKKGRSLLYVVPATIFKAKKTNFFLYYDFNDDENDNNNDHNNKNRKMEWKRKRKDILTLEYERHHVVQRPTSIQKCFHSFIFFFCYGYDVIKQKAALYVFFISKRIVKCRD